jgi:hypothetical protein
MKGGNMTLPKAMSLLIKYKMACYEARKVPFAEAPRNREYEVANELIQALTGTSVKRYEYEAF